MQELQNEHRIYSTAERRNAVEHAERVVAGGGTVADAARELAIPVKKLYRWREPRVPSSPRESSLAAPLLPVRVIEAHRASVSPASSGPVVVGGCGVRVEGLSILQIADLLRALG